MAPRRVRPVVPLLLALAISVGWFSGANAAAPIRDVEYDEVEPTAPATVAPVVSSTPTPTATTVLTIDVDARPKPSPRPFDNPAGLPEPTPTSTPTSTPTPSPEPTPVGPPRLNHPVLRWLPEIIAASQATGVPAELIAAVIQVESQGNPNVISPAGARGLMQIMPSNLVAMGVPEGAWHDPATNIMAGSSFLATRGGSWANAVAAYFGFGCDVFGTCTDVYVSVAFGWANYYAGILANIGGSGFAVLGPNWVAPPIAPFVEAAPSPIPTPPPATPTPEPAATATPTPSTTTPPTETPTSGPTAEPTMPPTVVPTATPTAVPTAPPTAVPTVPPDVPTAPPPPEPPPSEPSPPEPPPTEEGSG